MGSRKIREKGGKNQVWEGEEMGRIGQVGLGHSTPQLQNPWLCLSSSICLFSFSFSRISLCSVCWRFLQCRAAFFRICTLGAFSRIMVSGTSWRRYSKAFRKSTLLCLSRELCTDRLPSSFSPLFLLRCLVDLTTCGREERRVKIGAYAKLGGLSFVFYL